MFAFRLYYLFLASEYAKLQLHRWGRRMERAQVSCVPLSGFSPAPPRPPLIEPNETRHALRTL